MLVKESIPRISKSITKHWSPKLAASLNGTTEIKVAKLLGEFTWHDHQDSDEIFYNLGPAPLTIQFREEDGGDVVLEVGELLCIPRGVQHCPLAPMETTVLLIEGCGVINTGDVIDERLTNAVEDVRRS